ESRIREASPRYAALVQPQPLDLAAIQREILDPGTALLEFMTGEECSFLWAVTRNTLKSYVLPGRAELEGMARRAYDAVKATTIEQGQSGALLQLSRTLLGRVAPQLGSSRLVIVASGALQYVPFAALPSPLHPDVPLIAEHEIVSLPSA